MRTIENASFISASDPRWSTRQAVEISSASFDPDMQFVGSSPFLSDTARTGVVIPTGPLTGTCFQNTRYLARLCGIDIPEGAAVAIVGLRQLATIRSAQLGTSGTNESRCIVPFEREIVSANWSFVDGNISWHIRYQPVGIPKSPATLEAGLVSAKPYGTVSFNPFGGLTFDFPYQAPDNGVPPGQAVGNFGTWRDLRFPWQNTNNTDLRHIVAGPGSLVFYASVRQTNPFPEDLRELYPDFPYPEGFVYPDTAYPRCVFTGTITDPGALRYEDRFLLEFPYCQYGRVAGALMLELLPNYQPSTVG